MLDFVYYPVSFVLWCWHQVFGAVLGDAAAVGWGLAIVFLVFTLRALLLRPMLTQARFMRRMQDLAPRMREIRRKHADDQVRQSEEMQRLFQEHRVNPLLGYLPMLLQFPVFLGLNHVLRGFTATSGGNYFFPAPDVQTYLAAKLFGAHLGEALVDTALTGGTHTGLFLWQVAPVTIPLVLFAAVATHLTARLAAARQQAASDTGGTQHRVLTVVSLYAMPVALLLFGAALPIGLLLYWVSNNTWTLAQQHFLTRRLDAEVVTTHPT